MNISNFLLGAAAGVFGCYLWKRIAERSGKSPKQLTVSELAVATTDELRDQTNNLATVIKRQYEIVMPSDQIAKKVREKGKSFTARRFPNKKIVDNQPIAK